MYENCEKSSTPVLSSLLGTFIRLVLFFRIVALVLSTLIGFTLTDFLLFVPFAFIFVLSTYIFICLFRLFVFIGKRNAFLPLLRCLFLSGDVPLLFFSSLLP